MREEEICFIFKKIAESTASIIRKHFGEENYLEVVNIGVSGDVTRRIDLIAEKHIVSRVEETGLQAWVLGEERGLWRVGEKPDYIVLADPLDGSLNYAHRIPFASISIAVYKGLTSVVEPKYGIVYNVFTGDVVELCGNSVFINGNAVNKYLNRGIELASIYAESPLHIERVKKALEASGVNAKVRTMGSASIEAAYAALGLIGYFAHLTGKLRNTDIPVALAIASKLDAGVYIDPPLPGIRLDAVQNIKKVLISYKNSPLLGVLDRL
ncbi:MAG: inositol monophosphatase family protein [Desulfurococcaceae archaeon]